MAPRDTSPEIEKRMNAAYRRMSAAEKISRMSALTAVAHALALARIRSEHPLESEREHRLRLATRWLQRDQMIAAFGWDPDAHP
jgi:hypothetical protein